MNRLLLGIISVLVMISVTGCAGSGSRTTSSSYAFLYPDTAEKIEEPGMAVLSLPVKVGIAFVPEGGSEYGVHYRTTTIPEARKRALLDRVAGAFKDREFIGSIEVIPSAYLRPKGSFTNLDQISTMYDIDIIALVSYDQLQTTDQGAASLTYWTLVGAYIIPGEKNTTTTLVDTAVYDIKSRRMLFRAPGISEVKGSATPINQSEELRADSAKATSLAVEEMIRNLDAELERFREKVKERPNDFKIVSTPSYSGGGGGAFGLSLLPLLVIKKRRLV